MFKNSLFKWGGAVLILLLASILVVSCHYEIPATPDYEIESDGTWLIYTAEGLMAWNEAVTGDEEAVDLTLSAKLMADIELSNPGDGEDSNWTPVGTYTSSSDNNPYTGTFDGSGYTISNLTISSEDSYVGMFGYIGSEGSVENLDLVNVNISGKGRVGAIAGRNSGTIYNCYVDGTVDGSGYYVGGLVGNNIYGTIEWSHSSAKVSNTNYYTDTNYYAGGITGASDYGKVIACWFDGEVSGRDQVGGIAGNVFEGGTIVACYSLGTVIGNEQWTGGVVGRINDATTISSYAVIKYLPDRNIGGVYGNNFLGSCITSYYSVADDAEGTGSVSENGIPVDTWASAVEAMNTSLEEMETDYGYRFVENSDDNPPTLVKN